MQRNLIVTLLVATLMAGFVLAYTALWPEGVRPGMGGGMAVEGPHPPLVRGYAEGQEILFLHTESSDPQVAELLTEMMGSPVLVVPSLAEVDEKSMANVYVFQNGVKGEGPFGFQPDIFDRPPESEGYSPLRAVHLVRWQEESVARELRSASAVQQAEARGELRVERSGIVVNMPFVRWPGGQR